MGEARNKITHILQGRRYDPAMCIVTFPVEGGCHYVQIHFESSADYARSKNLRLFWNKQELRLASSAAPMEGLQTVIKINDVLCTGPDPKVMTEIFETLGKFMHIETMWRLDHKVFVKDRYKTVRGASVMAVAEYQRSFESSPTEFWEPHQIPGWIWTSNGIFQLHVLGRQPSCELCRQTELLPYYHTTEECTKRLCPTCRRSGHIEIKCPFRSENSSRTVELLVAYRRGDI